MPLCILDEGLVLSHKATIVHVRVAAGSCHNFRLRGLSNTATNAENSKQIFPVKELRGHSPNFHIYVSVSDLYISTIDLPILLKEICGPILGISKSLTHTLMWKLGLRLNIAQFLEKEYINGIFVAVKAPKKRTDTTAHICHSK